MGASLCSFPSLVRGLFSRPSTALGSIPITRPGDSARGEALLLPTSRKPPWARRSLVPEGHLKKAQRFIAGSALATQWRNPVGRDERPASFNRPYGTWFQSTNVIPAMNRRAILTCPHGASLETRVIARAEARRSLPSWHSSRLKNPLDPPGNSILEHSTAGIYEQAFVAGEARCLFQRAYVLSVHGGRWTFRPRAPPMWPARMHRAAANAHFSSRCHDNPNNWSFYS